MQSMDVTVRLALGAEQSEVLSWVEAAQAQGEVWALGWSREKLTQSFASAKLWVAVPSEEPLAGNLPAGSFRIFGFLLFREGLEAWEVDLVAVRDSWRRRGLFRRLMFELFNSIRSEALAGPSSPPEASRQLGKKVWLEVHETNISARAAYENLGFSEVGRRLRYYRDGGTAILLTKDCQVIR